MRASSRRDKRSLNPSSTTPVKAWVSIGSYSAVKKYIRKLKKREDIFIRIHTPAGHEAQVDFGYVGRTREDSGISRKTWVFNMRLSYSRLDYYEKVYDQKVETFINCHINAFEFFGGVPEVVKIDPGGELLWLFRVRLMRLLGKVYFSMVAAPIFCAKFSMYCYSVSPLFLELDPDRCMPYRDPPSNKPDHAPCTVSRTCCTGILLTHHNACTVCNLLQESFCPFYLSPFADASQHVRQVTYV
jgi:hypothetical protein